MLLGHSDLGSFQVPWGYRVGGGHHNLTGPNRSSCLSRTQQETPSIFFQEKATRLLFKDRLGVRMDHQAPGGQQHVPEAQLGHLAPLERVDAGLTTGILNGQKFWSGSSP